jgi:hypothetical protein
MTTAATKTKQVFVVEEMEYADQRVHGNGFAIRDKRQEGFGDCIVATHEDENKIRKVADILNSLSVGDADLVIGCISDAKSCSTQSCMNDGLF